MLPPELIKVNMKKVSLLIMILSIGLMTKVSAKPISFLTKDKFNNYYRYDYYELTRSSEDKILHLDAPLYDDYYKKHMVAFEDDINGYIDRVFVEEKAENAAIFKEKFDFDECLSIYGKQHIVYICNNINNVTEKNGQIIINKQNEEFDVLKIF